MSLPSGADREIVPGVKWAMKGGWAIAPLLTSNCDEGFIEVSPSGKIFTAVPHFPSFALARKAAEDLVCRLNGVPTEAERERNQAIDALTPTLEALDRMDDLREKLEAENAELRAEVERLKGCLDRRHKEATGENTND